MPNRITAANIKIKVAGKDVDPNHITSVEVHSDLNQPDMADICLSNFGDAGGGGGGAGGGGLAGMLSGLFDRVGSGVAASRFSASFRLGDDLEVLMGLEGEAPQLVCKGLVSGSLPGFDTHLPVTVNVRGLNNLHKLSRTRKTRTFVNQKDQDIISKIASENGLSAKFGKFPPTLMHEHPHQWNQTDLEFLRLRASRTARNLWVDLDNSTLYYVKYEKDQGPVAELNYTEEGDSSLENFCPQSNAGARPRRSRSTAGIEKKSKILGNYDAPASPLGSEMGASAFGDSPVLTITDVRCAQRGSRSRRRVDLHRAQHELHHRHRDDEGQCQDQAGHHRQAGDGRQALQRQVLHLWRAALVLARRQRPGWRHRHGWLQDHLQVPARRRAWASLPTSRCGSSAVVLPPLPLSCRLARRVQQRHHRQILMYHQ